MKYNKFVIFGCLLIKNIFSLDELKEIEKKLSVAYCSIQEIKNVNLKNSWKIIYNMLWQEYERQEYEIAYEKQKCQSMEQKMLKNFRKIRTKKLPRSCGNLNRYAKHGMSKKY